MKINSVKAIIIVSLIIIILYIVGLFLPIIINTKNSKIQNSFRPNIVSVVDKKLFFF